MKATTPTSRASPQIPRRSPSPPRRKDRRIHDACEQLVKTGTCPDKYRLHADAAVAELHRLFPEVNDWVAEKSFAHPLGFGGKCDLHSPSTGIIVDYKTKDGDFSDGKRLHYDQHWQLAAYAVWAGIRYRESGASDEATRSLFHPRWIP